jgi:hypothetical protein
MAYIFNYVNFFKIDADAADNPGFLPALDTDASFELNVLKDMQTAVLGTPFLDPAQRPGDKGGFIVEFENEPPHRASETIYAVDRINKLNSAPTLVAEVQFDSPRATWLDGTPNNQATWAVGVNFKTGDQTDGPDDMFVGPTCQFVEGGNINFNFTDQDQSQTGTYDDYASQSTRFKLLVEIHRTSTTFEANGSLSIDGQFVFFGEITDPGFGSLTAAAATSAPKITAAGIAVAITGKDANQNILVNASKVSVRLISFRLFYGLQEPVTILTTRFPKP